MRIMASKKAYGSPETDFIAGKKRKERGKKSVCASRQWCGGMQTGRRLLSNLFLILFESFGNLPHEIVGLRPAEVAEFADGIGEIFFVGL